MADHVENAMLEILKRIHAGVADLRSRTSGVEARLGGVEDRLTIESRLEQLETVTAKNRRDTAGLLVVFKPVAGDFVEQIAAMDERAKAREGTRA